LESSLVCALPILMGATDAPPKMKIDLQGRQRQTLITDPADPRCASRRRPRTSASPTR
jgi:hypothetical protein